KQYREADGRFYFKLLDGDGALLVQSGGFDSPREAGQTIAVLKQATAADALESPLFQLEAGADEVLEALHSLREAS
ncbi:hypothetical protein SB775_32845, partial [Peribacillus sp. SIMBA_075]|uniref:hypothetical protein n=1 Tax=Peribacillus sp. SIMBA_075 TaxID=3085813 RepID=UPI00397927A0